MLATGQTESSECGDGEKREQNRRWRSRIKDKPTRLLAKASYSWPGSKWEEEAVEVLSSLRLTDSCLLLDWTKTYSLVSEGRLLSLMQATKAGITALKALQMYKLLQPQWANSKSISTLLPFSRMFKSSLVFTCFCLPNYFLPLKSKGQVGKHRWQQQCGSPMLWKGSSDALVDEPLAAMLILRRSWAVSSKYLCINGLQRDMIPQPCHIIENRIVAEWRDWSVNCPRCRFTSLQPAWAEGFAGWGSSQVCAMELMVIPRQVELSSASWHGNQGELLWGRGYVCMLCIRSLLLDLGCKHCLCVRVCARVHASLV